MGAKVAAVHDTDLPQGYIVTFTRTASGVGGLELLAIAGDYLYTLKALENPDAVSRPAEEQLLRALLACG